MYIFDVIMKVIYILHYDVGFCIFLIQTYDIEDLIKNKFTNLQITKIDDRIINATLTEENLIATGGSSYGAFIENVFQFYGDYEVSFKVLQHTALYGYGVRIGFQSMSLNPSTEHLYEKNVYSIGLDNTSKKLEYSESSFTKYNASWNNGSLIQFKIIGNTITAYCDGTQIYQRTATWLHDTMRIICHGWGSTAVNIGITDFKVKSL